MSLFLTECSSRSNMQEILPFWSIDLCVIDSVFDRSSAHRLTVWPLQRIQDMEERRIERIAEAMRSAAESERKVLPAASRCLDAMMDAAESIQPRKVRPTPGGL